MKEIELLKIIFKDSPDILKPLNKIDKEMEKLHSIIKEAREYLELFNDNSNLIDHSIIKGALNLLDKVGNE